MHQFELNQTIYNQIICFSLAILHMYTYTLTLLKPIDYPI